MFALGFAHPHFRHFHHFPDIEEKLVTQLLNDPASRKEPLRDQIGEKTQVSIAMQKAEGVVLSQNGLSQNGYGYIYIYICLLQL
jgi:hypothetical protein